MLTQLLNASAGVIGGADGPTSVYITGDLAEALHIMANGMLGIFVVIGLIAILVALLTRVSGRK